MHSCTLYHKPVVMIMKVVSVLTSYIEVNVTPNIFTTIRQRELCCLSEYLPKFIFVNMRLLYVILSVPQTYHVMLYNSPAICVTNTAMTMYVKWGTVHLSTLDNCTNVAHSGAYRRIF